MIKEERHQFLLEQLKQKQVITVTDITQTLKVTDMTIRRDLQELEEKGLLVRVHGGARAITDEPINPVELSHLDKKEIHLKEKKEIASLIASEIKEGETVFLGSGTTIELVYDYLTINYAKIITNSIYVFDKFKHDSRFDLVLIGGAYRSKTGAFVGTIANDLLSTIHVQKAFIGVNAIDRQYVYNSNEDEGLTQSHILNSAEKKYILTDYSKFNKRDFYNFYALKNIDYLITDSRTDSEVLNMYQETIKIINK
ncbi:DeoR/GlpR family DNA-binding transcription regulator [Enterococcus sp. LJL98]